MLWLAAAILLMNDATVLNDTAVTGYVERVARQLGANVPVTVVVDSEARAGALPDSGVVIATAMIAGAHNEAELAGMLAHQIAHLRARTMAPPPDQYSGICLRFNKHDPPFETAKQWERDADQIAIAMLTKAGYDPVAMLRYFSAVRHASPALPRAFSAEDILIERLQLEATDHPMKDPIVDTPEFQAIQARLK